MTIALGLALVAAAGACGLAWGYRGQRDQEREQVVYLRAQLAPKPGNVAAIQDQRGAQRGPL